MIIKDKKAQITIFIIVAIAIIVAIILFFLIGKKPIMNLFGETNPSTYIEKCAKDAVEEAEKIMLPQGGYISPENFKLYDDKKIAYLCYQKNYYQPCINQEPLYLKHLEEEITNFSRQRIEACFLDLKDELEKENYAVNLENEMNVLTEIKPKVVEIEIKRKLEMSKGGESRSFEDFRAKLNSPLYELANVAIEITNQEARFCYFEYVGFMLLYPEYEIDKKAVGGAETSSKIYIIGDRASGKKLYMVIRSCAFPAGL